MCEARGGGGGGWGGEAEGAGRREVEVFGVYWIYFTILSHLFITIYLTMEAIFTYLSKKKAAKRASCTTL